MSENGVVPQGIFLFSFSKHPRNALLPQGVGTGGEMTPSISVVSEAEAELQREVEELKLRLHMAAEHYKEKYRECQRLRRQVAKLNTTESQGVSSFEVKLNRQGPNMIVKVNSRPNH